MPYKDPEKQRAAQAAWAAKARHGNREHYRNGSRHRKRKAAEFVRRYKEWIGCVDCLIKYPHMILEFDHVRGEKKSNIGAMVSGQYSIAKIKEEIRKCEVVCSNCHRVRTWSRLEVKYGR